MPGRSSRFARFGASVVTLIILVGCRSSSEGSAGLTGPSENSPSSVTLTWDAPSENEDGSPLTDLAGHRLYYGTATPLTVSNSTAVDVGSGTTHTIAGLAPGIYFVAVSAYDSLANEGPLSQEILLEVLP